jgi:hypothetical protein
MWAAIVGFVLPPVIAIIVQEKWKPGLKAIVAFGACLLSAVGTVYLQGPDTFTLSRWVTASLTTLTVAIATYHGLWRPTGTAPAIEHSTSPQ